MPLPAWLTNAIAPALKAVDELSTSGEERGKLRLAFAEAQAEIAIQVLEYEKAIISSQAKVITAEATSQSWLTRNWRPLLMITFTYIIAHNYVFAPVLTSILQLFDPNYALVHLELPPDMWGLLKIGVGGYIVGRSGEQIAKTITNGKPLDFSKGSGGK